MVTATQINNYAQQGHNLYKQLSDLQKKSISIREKQSKFDEVTFQYVRKTYGNPLSPMADKDPYVLKREKTSEKLEKDRRHLLTQIKTLSRKCDAFYTKMDNLGIIGEVQNIEKNKYKGNWLIRPLYYDYDDYE